MGNKWTKEQEQAIRLRDRNILVSAAAGSGKTAVLVERILSRVTDPGHPTDIDRLLVVTFTKAAAGEMKERIGRALEQRLLEDPDNEHLQRQGTLLHHARISTIHGFCTYVIQNYFHRIDLDPGYRIGDDGEMRMLKKEVLRDLLEEEYAAGRQEFLDFSETCAPGKNDARIEDLLQRTAEFAESYPWPEVWLESCLENYRAKTEEDLEQTAFIRFLEEDAARGLRDLKETARQLLEDAEGPGGPEEYLPMLEADLELLQELEQKRSYREYYEAFQKLSFKTLSRKKTDCDPEVKERIKNRRDSLKTAVKDIGSRYFSRSPQALLEELAGCRNFAEELIRLTEAYMRAFSERKRRKNLMDFSDLEHFALKILLEREGETIRRTEAARELAAQFEEVMVDEYQDSNYIQEYLLWAVSREEDGSCNRFMVGDMKQAIYSFRQARPEIFLEKYLSYSKEDGPRQRIDLSRNFRSRREVLDTVNDLFRRIMGRDLGGLEYDRDAALYYGAGYPENGGCETELLLLDRKSPDFEEDRSKRAAMEAEAFAVAKKIRSLVGQMQVTEGGQLRPLRYRDCVILLRQTAGWDETFSRVLEEEGIPVSVAAKSGYFRTIEVSTVLNYLRICDNPRQDIPFAAALHSPMGDVTEGELAAIKSGSPDLPIYEAAAVYAREGKEQRLRAKLNRFLETLEQFREALPYTPVHQVILNVLEDTGYGAAAAAMPGGEQRQANLDMLVKKAADFESTSYHGLFQFIRYMEQMERYKVDFGEVSLYGELADTVRIMTIHKSKGLEFPVVFVCGLGSRMNLMDANAPVVFHHTLGIGADWIDLKNRTRVTPLLKEAIRQAIRLDARGEELRVLYVALTRAKEKLILTGASENLEKKLGELSLGSLTREGKVSYWARSGAGCFLDWILPALKDHPALKPLRDMAEEAGSRSERTVSEEENRMPLQVQLMTPDSMTLQAADQGEEREARKEAIRSGRAAREEDPVIREFLEEQDGYRYPWAEEEDIPAALTVSELKQRELPEDPDRQAMELYPEADVVPLIPKFMKEEKEELQGAALGTIYHRILERLDLEREVTEASLREQLKQMVNSGLLRAGEAETVRIPRLLRFASSSIGKRMQAAARRGQLKREQTFVMGVPAAKIQAGWPEDEQILVQGIIDAYFEEEQGWVIVDYKTDRVPSGDIRELIPKYGRQLELYGKALEQISGKPVKEMVLYSLTLGREIPVEKGGL